MHQNSATLIGFLGVSLLLLAFFLNLFKFVRAKGYLYLTLNLVGGALACYSSYLINFMPFVLLVRNVVAGRRRCSCSGKERARRAVSQIVVCRETSFSCSKHDIAPHSLNNPVGRTIACRKAPAHIWERCVRSPARCREPQYGLFSRFAIPSVRNRASTASLNLSSAEDFMHIQHSCQYPG